jgi:hypothetical protein
VVAVPVKEDIDMKIRSVGIVFGKTTFHLVALGAAGKALVRKKFTQKPSVSTSNRNRRCVSPCLVNTTTAT